MWPLSRKSVGPTLARVDRLLASALHQSLRHFVAKAAWSRTTRCCAESRGGHGTAILRGVVQAGQPPGCGQPLPGDRTGQCRGGLSVASGVGVGARSGASAYDGRMSADIGFATKNEITLQQLEQIRKSRGMNSGLRGNAASAVALIALAIWGASGNAGQLQGRYPDSYWVSPYDLPQQLFPSAKALCLGEVARLNASGGSPSSLVNVEYQCGTTRRAACWMQTHYPTYTSAPYQSGGGFVTEICPPGLDPQVRFVNPNANPGCSELDMSTPPLLPHPSI